MKKLRTGDTVVVITGKDKGKTGVLLKVLSLIQRVVVADVNMRTRHVPKNASRPGQILKYEASIHWSNVMVLDPKTKRGTRVGFRIDEKGKAVRIARKSGEVLVASKAQPAKKKLAAVPQTTASEKAPQAAKKGPFWKKLGFGAAEMAERAEVEGSTHMQEDHTVPDQLERQTGRSHSRGS
ncbi:50S ribosomal protein L24 [Candidatus Peribacteria bacterium RIFCSPLOWO2_12_FULL_53_10]|nr:MAG: 50S ribosomal protein L24 [Candidatus Peribacteria bacterium RIFCSPLOWO2_12_FULL_53_10]